MSEDLIIESKVVARDDVDTGILLNLPVGETQTLGLSKEVGLRKLASPVFRFKSAAAFIALLGKQGHSHASVAFFRSRFTPIRGNPRMAD
jgi:hypothetical protein